MTETELVEVLGVDSCPSGWVAAVVRNGKFASLHHYTNLAELVEAHPGAKAIGIDIPLWFPDGDQPRPSDPAARTILGTRRSSVFAVPPRNVLEESSYAQANQLSKSRYGRGISRQSYALRTKILESVEFLEKTGNQRLFEVHPELSFHFLATSFGTKITASKKTWAGFAERLSLLKRVSLAPSVEARENLGRAAPDDVIDASVAAWTANRIATGQAELVGATANSARADQQTGQLPVIYA